VTVFVYPTDLLCSIGTDLYQQWRWLSDGTIQHPAPTEQTTVGASAIATVWDPLTFQTVDLAVSTTPDVAGSAITFFTPDGGTVQSGIQLLIRAADLLSLPFSPPFQDLRLAWKLAVTLASGDVVPFAGGSLWLTP
jgi:hypothetical protein